MSRCRAVIAALLGALSSWAAAQTSDRPAPVADWRLQEIGQVAAGGDVLSRPEYRPEGWHRATVPGTVLTSLVDDGVYPEPLYGENNRTIPESLCRTSYWYRATFPVPSEFRAAPSIGAKTGPAARHLWLNFAGINYAAEIWVDGVHVGGMKGAFVRGQFDITTVLTPGAPTAAVAVKISPPPHPGNPLEQTVAAGTGPNGGALGADGPSFEATVGWDWIPGIRDRDIGIWQGVTVTTTGPVIIRDPYVVTSLPLPRTDSADLHIQASMSNLDNTPAHVVVEGRIDGAGIRFRVPMTVPPGPDQTITLPVVRVPHPKLWWPNGYGAPNLYRLHLQARDGSDLSDATTVSFGIRTIKYFPDGGKNLTLIVNGVPVFARGGNWGMDEAMKRSPRARLEAQLRLHRDANCNMIRNWIGMSTEEDFYDMCDRYGMMVWDDFWLANPVDGPNPLDPDLFIANAREKILRFRNHPSIAVWCGRNEGMPPAKINDALQSMVANLDGTRFYQPHSSSLNGVGGGGPYSYRKPADYFGSFRDAFHTEIGGPSIPTLEAIEAMMPRRDWWPMNDDWAEHDLCRGAQRGDVYADVLSGRFGKVLGFEDFVRKAQLANYESYRAIFEAREEKLFDPATGVLLWMSNPSQPSFVWQLYSYDLDPTAAMFGTKKACEPIHVEMDPHDRRVFVVNSTPKALGSVTVHADIYDAAHRVASQQGTASVGPTKAQTILTLDISDPRFTEAAVTFVHLEARDARGRLLSDNLYWQSRPTAANDYMPGDLSALQFMPVVTLNARASTNLRSSGQARVTVTLDNPSSSIALMTHLQLRRGDSGARVLPAYYGDNYVSLMPHESRTISIDCATEDLRGEPPAVYVDGWNVRARSTGDVPVVTNVAAIPRETPIARSVSPDRPETPFARNLAVGGPTLEGTGFTPDDDFVDGGFARTQPATVDLSVAGSLAAPAAIYRTLRTGELTYTIPVPPGRAYTVRLHFADLSSTKAGARLFDVSINGAIVLPQFDIFGAAGDRSRAVVKEFHGVRPDPEGDITVTLRRGGAGLPIISAVQVVSE